MTSTPCHAHDVARKLRDRGVDEVKKLHKLLYYVQGWHLAEHGVPAFEEDVAAWEMGPVIADLWADEKHRRPQPTAGEMPSTVLEVIERVVERYGAMSGRALEEKTHREAPWVDRWNDRLFTDRIDRTAMRDWFLLQRDADAARARRREHAVMPR